MTPPPLTYLYVPGDRPDRLDRAAASGADAIVIDLEDAVAWSRKDVARDAAAHWLRHRSPATVPVWVRINAGPLGDSDLRAVIPAGVDGIWLPKCEDAAGLRRLDTMLSELESTSGAGHTAVSPLIETATGLWQARDIALGPRVRFLQIGEVDLAADLGVRPGAAGLELVWARSVVVAASAAAGIAPPLAAASPEFRDTAAFAAESRQLAAAGFVGRACIHPDQLPAVVEAFTPTPDEVSAARDILDALRTADSGVAVDRSGRLIDEAVARGARRLLARLPGVG